MHASTQAKNPWCNLPRKGPFVLPEDRSTIESFNRQAKPEHQVRPEVLPVPFLGSLASANVVLLNLNPGIVDQDFEIFRSNKDYVEQNRRTLSFTSDPSFFYLEPRFSYTEGYKWWFNRLRKLIEVCGHKTVAAKVMCIEYFPYHSEKYKPTTPLISSQHYGFSLARQALESGKMIVAMRSHNLWLAQVPELGSYPCIWLNSPRSGYVTLNNMPPGDFQRLVSAVSKPGPLPRPVRRFTSLFRKR